MLLPNRHGNSSDYRYGFQNQEVDNEIKGEGNSVNFKYRMADVRLNRFFAVDPLEGKFPWWSPYQFSGNRLLDAVELEGKEIYFYVWDQGKTTGYTQVHHVQTVEEIKQESEVVFLTDLFGWTITQTANLRNLGIEQTFVLYDDSWKLVPSNKLNQSLTQITKDEWDSFLTLDNINNSIEALRSIGAKAELAISIVELGDGLKNLYQGYKALRKGKLSGSRTKLNDKMDDATKRSLNRENETADILTDKGYNVEQNPKVLGNKNPDFKINGKIFDNYAPETSNVRNIWSVVQEKVLSGQTNRVVVNLGDFKGDFKALQKQFKDYSIEGLEEIIFINNK
jgi:hypothetical protein